MLRARTLEELIDAAALFSSQPLPRGRRVAVVTNAGGLGILCADACEAAGLSLPELAPETRTALAAVLPREASLANPVDLIGSATAPTYEAALPPLLADTHVDAVIVLFVPPVVAGADEVGAAIRQAVADAGTEKPVLAVVMSADGTPATLLDSESPVAAFPYPESAAHALGFAAERAEWLRRPVGRVPVLDGVDAAAARRVVESALTGSSERWLTPAQTRELLTAYGVPIVPERLAQTPDEAVAAARGLGLPAVVKTATPGAHKTETGGVALDLRDEEQVHAAAERIGGPVLVQPFLRGGVELLAGVVQDPVFGPLVAFGPGGHRRVSAKATRLVGSGKAGRLVGGFRGAPPADSAALVDLVHRLAQLAEDLPEVSELDLNPVVARPDGCVAVDARIRVHARPRAASLKGW